MCVFLATITRSIPQFGLLPMLVLLPLQILSGNLTPRESMPEFIQFIMLSMPTSHFVALVQAVLYRGGAFSRMATILRPCRDRDSLFFLSPWHGSERRLELWHE